MTQEQAGAFTQLRALACPHRFRVIADPEGWPIIPGRLGQGEYYDGHDLAVFTTRPRLFPKLWAIPGVRQHQTGDTEMRAVFPPEALDQVAGIIRTRRRAVRIMTPERLAVLAGARQKARTVCPRTTSRPQDRTGSADPGWKAGTGPLDGSRGPRTG